MTTAAAPSERRVIVDTSALLCVLLDEPEAARLLEAIVDAPAPRMSAANWLEVAMIVEERGGRLASLRLDEFVRAAGIEIAPVTVEQAEAARNAWRYFGRHKHSARLDFGDCFAYALAKTTGEALLYTGADFARTDVEPAAAGPSVGAPGHQAAGAHQEARQAPRQQGASASEQQDLAEPAQQAAGEPGLRDLGAPRQRDLGAPEARGSGMPEQRGLGAPEQRGLDAPEQRGSGAPEQRSLGAPGQRGLGAPGQRSLGVPGRDAPVRKDH